MNKDKEKGGSMSKDDYFAALFIAADKYLKTRGHLDEDADCMRSHYSDPATPCTCGYLYLEYILQEIKDKGILRCKEEI